MKSGLAWICLALWVGSASAQDANSALGYWKSVSDVKGEEGKVTAVWKLSVDAKGDLQGTIVWAPDSKPDDKYTSQKREFNGLPYRGTFWMKDLRPDGPNRWKGGSIVDVGNPKGDVYGCEIEVIDHGQRLHMRGYILGMSLFGRTQTWLAVSASEVAALGS